MINLKASFEEQVEEFKNCLKKNLYTRLIKHIIDMDQYEVYLTTAYAVFDNMIENWLKTQTAYMEKKPKRIFYISMEFLMGRTLSNALISTGLYEIAKEALAEYDVNLEEVIEEEVDAGLGNGGLGRLAACFLDSMANLGIPCHGYGLEYEFGMFNQYIENGKQVEKPDNWKAVPYPWAVDRYRHRYTINYNGQVTRFAGNPTNPSVWEKCNEVVAVAKDVPIPGFKSGNVNILRLWSAKATESFNLDDFSDGDYISACENQVESENITKVLYPNDNVFVGKLLRLKQEYLLVSASVQDIVHRFIREHGKENLADFDKYVAIQMNDTHPALAVAELMRIFIDQYAMKWEDAWNTVTKTCAYTNHTLLPEALEEWPVSMMERLLPRHMEIIYQINYFFMKEVSLKYPGDVDKMRSMSIIAEEGTKRVRMASLAVIGSHKVNGVAALHSDLVKQVLFKDYYELTPEKFINVTNGITPRRWIMSANKRMAKLISETIGEDWKYNFEELAKLEKYADDLEFIEKWIDVKKQNKHDFAVYISRETGIAVNPDTLFDVQVKRIHEYKRQLLLTLFAIHRYLFIKNNPSVNVVPRTIMIGGKAAPGYLRAKQIIYFINKVGEMINSDPDMKGKLKLVFLPNYRVSLAEHIMPAADLSEQISTAGYEASGTGNMKMTLNGALTIGTLDGANVEIRDRVEDENIFIFGKTAQEVIDMKRNGYAPKQFISESADLQAVINLIDVDFFSQNEHGAFKSFVEEFLNEDRYMLMADFDSYIATQKKVEELYLNPKEWAKKSILNVARCSFFSSDRSIEDYNRLVWNAEPVLLS